MTSVDPVTQMAQEDPLRYGALMICVFMSQFMIYVFIFTFLFFMSKIIATDRGYNKFPQRRR